MSVSKCLKKKYLLLCSGTYGCKIMAMNIIVLCLFSAHADSPLSCQYVSFQFILSYRAGKS